jgi:hypothetical protein
MSENIENIDLQLAQFNSLLIADNLLPIVLMRQQKLQIVTAESIWEAGDRIIYLLYTPKLLSSSSNAITIDVSSELFLGEINTEIGADNTTITTEPKIGATKEAKSLEPQDFLSMAREILKNPE